MKQLTEKQNEFIQVYRKNCGDIHKTSMELQISPKMIEKYLQNETVKEQLNRSIQIAREKIETATPYLVDLAMEMIQSENVGDKIRAQLLNSLLDRGGVNAPKEPSVSININTEISDRARTLLAQSMQKDYTSQIESKQ